MLWYLLTAFLILHSRVDFVSDWSTLWYFLTAFLILHSRADDRGKIWELLNTV
jgi:hypothetical protein